MSYEFTKRAFGLLNDGIQERYDDGDPLTLVVRGKPKFQIVSFEPFAIGTYDTFRNRAPYLTGELALRGFLTQPDGNNGVFVYAGLEADRCGYGYFMNGANPQARAAIEDIANILGYPELELA